MQSDAKTPEEYLSELDPTRREAISAVRTVILDNLPDGYDEVMQYGMISYIVPLSVIPDTYNGQPLMYICPRFTKALHVPLPHHRLRRPISVGLVQTALSRHRQKAQHGQIMRSFRKLENLPLDLVAEVTALTPLAKFVEETKSYRSA